LNILFIGAPGSGKGTQSRELIEKHGFVQLSTGDLLRDSIKNKTELGHQAQVYMDQGKLVPDDLIISMVNQFIDDHKGKPVIFDGFPRTVAQAQALDAFVEAKGQSIDLVLQLDVPEDIIKERIAERQKVSGRADDDQEKLLKRIDEYFQKTIHVLPYYQEQGKVVTVNGVGAIDAIFEQICQTIDSRK